MRQLVELIPPYLVPKLARVSGIDKQARTFSAWSHVVVMLYAQVSRAMGLNDVCDALKFHISDLFAMRAASAPAPNTLSHANKTRDCSMAEQLFWSMLAHLQSQWPAFARGCSPKKLWRMRRAIHVVDSTTVRLVVSCIDWARHRVRKAAAKIHTRMSLQSFLPAFVIIGPGAEHDNVRAPALCAALREGEVVLFDKAYVHFKHLFELAGRGVFFVTREKTNLKTKRVKKLPRPKDRRILGDELIVLTGARTLRDYPQTLRRVRALVEIDGKQREMVFLTNNPEWSAVTLCELYRARWQIEVFFKQLKQTVQLVDFMGNSANAVKWQIWTALLAHLLLRYLAWQSSWEQSFSRLGNNVRAAMWLKIDLYEMLARYGTASGSYRSMWRPEQGWLRGFEPPSVG
jgi:hypothetical protein